MGTVREESDAVGGIVERIIGDGEGQFGGYDGEIIHLKELAVGSRGYGKGEGRHTND